MSDSSESPSVPEQAAPSANQTKGMPSKHTIALVVAIAVVGTMAMFYKLWDTSKASSGLGQKVVVLDTKLLMDSSQKQIMSTKGLSNEQAIAVSEKLALNMKKLVGIYHEQGYTVLNSGALITWPAEIDITPQFAEQLGVKLE